MPGHQLKMYNWMQQLQQLAVSYRPGRKNCTTSTCKSRKPQAKLLSKWMLTWPTRETERERAKWNLRGRERETGLNWAFTVSRRASLAIAGAADFSLPLAWLRGGRTCSTLSSSSLSLLSGKPVRDRRACAVSFVFRNCDRAVSQFLGVRFSFRCGGIARLSTLLANQKCPCLIERWWPKPNNNNPKQAAKWCAIDSIRSQD